VEERELPTPGLETPAVWHCTGNLGHDPVIALLTGFQKRPWSYALDKPTGTLMATLFAITKKAIKAE
jgi:hypothetical protein